MEQLKPKMMRVYISGPITSLKESVACKRFAEAEELLKQKEYEVVNPMTLNHNHNKLWNSYLKEDLNEMFNCHAIFLLEGWIHSKGARLEYIVAESLGMIIMGDKEYKLDPHINFDIERFVNQTFINETFIDSRKREVVIKRQYIMWYLRTIKRLSYKEIARYCKRDHTTVMHSVKVIDAIYDTKYKEGLDIIQQLKNSMFIAGYLTNN